MTIENREMGIRFEVDNQQDFDKWYAIRKEQIRADAIEECINGLCDDWRLKLILCKEDKDNLIKFLKLYEKQLKERKGADK